jgi:hypothetical protein
MTQPVVHGGMADVVQQPRELVALITEFLG